MRKSLLVSTSVVALMLGASAANAEETGNTKRYFSLFGGFANGLDSPFYLDDYVYDTGFQGGFTIGGAYGHYLTPSLRAEIEASYQYYAADSYSWEGNSYDETVDGHIDSISIMLNLWKDINLGTSFTPYVGGGAGIGHGSMSLDWSGEASKGSSIGFASQLGAGVRMDVSDRVKFDLGYRMRSVYGLVGANDEDATDITLANYYSHSVQAGLSYMLGENYGEMDAMDVAPSDVYYTLFAGVALPQDSVLSRDGYVYAAKNKVGFTTGAAVGTTLLPGWRGELEGAFTHYVHDSQTEEANQSDVPLAGVTNLYTVTANLWKDKQIGSHMAYVGGGLGFGIADADGNFDGSLFDGHGLGLAVQFGAGVRHAVSDNVAIDFGYRAKGVFGAISDGVNSGDHVRGSYMAHMLQVGLTYGDGMFETPETDDAMEQDHYVSLFAGFAKPEGAGTVQGSYTYELNHKTGFTVGGAVGTQIADNMRGELELSYVFGTGCGSRYEPDQDKCRYFDDDWNGNHHMVDLLANVWRDFDFDVVSPYVGGGVGLSASVLDIDGWGDPSVALAAQVGGGVRYPINDDLTFDLGYRFKGIFDTIQSGNNDSSSSDYHGSATFFTHTLTGGVAWDF